VRSGAGCARGAVFIEDGEEDQEEGCQAHDVKDGGVFFDGVEDAEGEAVEAHDGEGGGEEEEEALAGFAVETHEEEGGDNVEDERSPCEEGVESFEEDIEVSKPVHERSLFSRRRESGR